jgi:hypothetical protein
VQVTVGPVMVLIIRFQARDPIGEGNVEVGIDGYTEGHLTIHPFHFIGNLKIRLLFTIFFAARNALWYDSE